MIIHIRYFNYKFEWTSARFDITQLQKRPSYTNYTFFLDDDDLKKVW